MPNFRRHLSSVFFFFFFFFLLFFFFFFVFYFNKLSLGKTFICKTDRLNVKQRRSRWDGSLSRLIWIYAVCKSLLLSPVAVKELILSTTRTSMTRTPMARSPWLIRIRFWLLEFFSEKKKKEYLGIFKGNFIISSCKCLLGVLIRIESYTQHTIISKPIEKTFLNYSHLPIDLALWLTLSGSNYPFLEKNSRVPRMFKSLKFAYTWLNFVGLA